MKLAEGGDSINSDHHEDEGWAATEHAVMQIVARTMDLQRRLGEADLSRLPSLRALFAAVEELTQEIGWADQPGEDEADGHAGAMAGMH